MSGDRQTTAGQGLGHHGGHPFLRTFGAPELAASDARRVLLGPGKPLAFLVYLCALPDFRASRDHILSMLWSDLGPKAARHALRQAIWYLRRILGEHALVTVDDDVALGVPVETDRACFLQAIRERRFEAAIEIYVGEFLPGFAVSGGVGFEHWADAERQHLRHLFVHAAEAVAREELRRGHGAHARTLAERIRSTDPFDERGWRLLLEVCLSQGDTISALAEADRLEQLLLTERRDPEPATLAVIRRVRGREEDDAEPDDRSLIAELVGRESEFAALIEAFERAQRRGLEAVRLVAPAGLGKTRLLEDVGRRLRAAGHATAYVRAHPGDRDIPWAYAAEVARVLAGLPGAPGVPPAAASTLVALDPALSGRFPVPTDPSTGDEARRRRVLALAELIVAVSEECPLALLLDDLHWADEPSREALQRALPRIERARMLIVFSTRPGAAALQEGLSRTLSLAPLTEDQVAAMLASLGRLPETRWGRALPELLCAATGGSPLLSLETLHHALECGVLDRDNGAWQCHDEAALIGLLEAGSALGRRIERLERGPRWLLLLASIAGIPQRLTILCHASGSSAERTIEELHLLESRGFVSRSGDRWGVAHDEIGHQAVEQADSTQRTAAHAALGRALLEGIEDREDLRSAAHHLALGSQVDGLVQVATAWIRSARTRGDSRAVPLLIEELMGPSRSQEEIRALSRNLPLRLRVTTPTRWLAGAVAVAAVAAIAAALPRPVVESEPAVTLAAWQPEPGGGWTLRTRELSEQDLGAGVVPLSSFVRTGILSPDRPEGLVRPGGGPSIATTMLYPDSGGLEVALLSSRGEPPIRLTNRSGDDYAGAWSPDGRLLVIATDRWSAESRSDLALVNLDKPAGGLVRLTHSAGGRDRTPVWSPDGTRIAFARTSYGDPVNQVCLVSADGHEEHCLHVPEREGLQLLGWISAVELAAEFSNSDGTTSILGVNTLSGAYRELAAGTGTTPSQTDGWIACYCRRSAAEPYQLLVFEADRPDRAVRVEPGDPPPLLTLLPAGPPTTYLDRVEIVGAGDPIPVDGAYRLAFRGWDAMALPAEPLAVRWTSSDTTVLSVDRTGTVRPRREGTATVVATAGGWRTDSTTVVIGPARFESKVTEDWRGSIEPRWVAFGDPRPSLVETDRGPALAPNGDSTLASGVYLRELLPTSRGIGVEMAVSVPLTSPSWQNILIRLGAARILDPARSDLEVGNLHGTGERWRECMLSYPRREGIAGQRTMAFGAGLEHAVPAPAGMASGRWTRVRIQLFPDGRCGLAVDGVARTIIDRHVPVGDSAILVLMSYSHRTRVLVGPVEVWSGVRRDVDWDTIER